jgi:heme A synthase
MAKAVTSLTFTQVGLGMLNVFLLAPVWMQLVHLLVADLVWIALILLGASVLARPSTARASGNAPFPAPRPSTPAVSRAS